MGCLGQFPAPGGGVGGVDQFLKLVGAGLGGPKEILWGKGKRGVPARVQTPAPSCRRDAPPPPLPPPAPFPSTAAAAARARWAPTLAGRCATARPPPRGPTSWGAPTPWQRWVGGGDLGGCFGGFGRFRGGWVKGPFGDAPTPLAEVRGIFEAAWFRSEGERAKKGGGATGVENSRELSNPPIAPLPIQAPQS